MIGDGMVTIMVSNMDRSLKFYKLLGFRQEYRSGDKWAEISGHKLYIGLHLDEGMRKMKRQRGSGNLTIGFEAKGGIEKAVAELKKKGVRISVDKKEADDYDMRFASFKDPDGNDLYLWE